MADNYDIQQVCENGHQITDCCNIRPEEQKDFCQKCGAATIVACPSCDQPIEGTLIGASQSWADAGRGVSKMVSVGRPASVPYYCAKCGEAYPWTEKKIIAAIQMFVEFGDLDEKEKSTIEEDIHNIAKDTPQSELSAMRIKKVWEKTSRFGYEVLMEFASRTAAKVLKD